MAAVSSARLVRLVARICGNASFKKVDSYRNGVGAPVTVAGLYRAGAGDARLVFEDGGGGELPVRANGEQPGAVPARLQMMLSPPSLRQ